MDVRLCLFLHSGLDWKIWVDTYEADSMSHPDSMMSKLTGGFTKSCRCDQVWDERPRTEVARARGSATRRL